MRDLFLDIMQRKRKIQRHKNLQIIGDKSRIDIRNTPENSETCKTNGKLTGRRCGLDLVSLDFILRC